MSELTRLSDYDFEILVRDLLSAELGVRLESFARGRDKGIDLRYLGPTSKTSQPGGKQAPDIIVQCKHYARTGYAGLKSKLLTSERKKVAKLSPKRYILVTSVDLTPSNKSELQGALSPYVQTESDIYGASDIDALLKRHPTVERAHYKLWLTSSEVLDRFLHSDIYRHTEHVLKNMERNAVRYVANDSYPTAKAILAKNHVCVIAGRAGIGKSTLAEMLLLEYAAGGYQPVVVSADISEANKVWSADPAVPQIFYYDDFLGQAAVADKLNKNEDARLGALLSRVLETKNKRLILTTREYVLEQAKQNYERLQQMNLDAHKHVVRLEDYTQLHRAQILYNHLYFSGLDASVRASVVPQRLYLKIIQHENYTPRLVDDIARRAQLDGIGADDFPNYFVRILDDPRTLWQHTFDHSLSQEARLVLLSLASLPPLTTLSALRSTYDALQPDVTAKPMFYALKEVDGDFLRTTQSGALTVISFFNPSVRDFVLARLLDSPPLRDRLLDVAPYFEQVIGMQAQSAKFFHGQTLARALIRTFHSGGCVVNAYGGPGSQVYGLSVMAPVARLEIILQQEVGEMTQEWLMEVVKGLASDWADGSLSGQGKILPIMRLVGERDPQMESMLVESLRSGLRSREIEDIGDAEFARDFMRRYDDDITDEDRDILGDLADSFASSEVEALLELDDPSAIQDRLTELQGLADDFGISISVADVRRIEKRIERLETEHDAYDDWDADRSGTHRSVEVANEADAIDDLFDTMERD